MTPEVICGATIELRGVPASRLSEARGRLRLVAPLRSTSTAPSDAWSSGAAQPSTETTTSPLDQQLFVLVEPRNKGESQQQTPYRDLSEVELNPYAADRCWFGSGAKQSIDTSKIVGPDARTTGSRSRPRLHGRRRERTLGCVNSVWPQRDGLIWLHPGRWLVEVPSLSSHQR